MVGAECHACATQQIVTESMIWDEAGQISSFLGAHLAVVYGNENSALGLSSCHLRLSYHADQLVWQPASGFARSNGRATRSSAWLAVVCASTRPLANICGAVRKQLHHVGGFMRLAHSSACDVSSMHQSRRSRILDFCGHVSTHSLLAFRTTRRGM
jgi:hypothetical protein